MPRPYQNILSLTVCLQCLNATTCTKLQTKDRYSLLSRLSNKMRILPSDGLQQSTAFPEVHLVAGSLENSSRRDCTPNSMKLLPTEEEAIVGHVLDLDARGFPPRLAAVKDMADSLLAERHRDPVGQNWAKTFR